MRIYKPNQRLDTNQAGLDLIMKAEKYEPCWYLCPSGIWTIGYGTTENSIPGVNRSAIRHPISREQAFDWLYYSLATTYEPVIESRVRVPLTENMFSALSSFVYNIGSNAFTRSTLLQKLNQKDYDGAADQFRKWVYAGGRVLRGLVHRRDAERSLFLSEPVKARVIPMHRVDVHPLPPKPVQIIPTTKPEMRLR